MTSMAFTFNLTFFQQDTTNKKGNPEYEAEVRAKEKKWERTIAMHLDSVNRGNEWQFILTALVEAVVSQ